MNNKIQLLLQFIKENPDLPVIPMVYYEVVDGDFLCCAHLPLPSIVIATCNGRFSLSIDISSVRYPFLLNRKSC